VQGELLKRGRIILAKKKLLWEVFCASWWEVNRKQALLQMVWGISYLVFQNHLLGIYGFVKYCDWCYYHFFILISASLPTKVH